MALKGISVASLTNPDKDGYLTKQGGSVKNWKKRWCVLKNGTVFYYKTPKDTTPKGTMELSATAKVKEVEIKKRKFTFEIETDKRTFPVQADSEAAKQAWMEAINKAIKQLAGGGGGGGGTGPITTPPNIPKPENKDPTHSTTTTTTTNPQPAPAGGAASGGGAQPGNTPANPPAAKAGGRSPRQQLAIAKGTIPFLIEKESKVLEFWQIWSESIPEATELGAGMSIEFYVSTSADMKKLNWRTAGPQHIFIQKMVDFFWGVGAPETEIDKLNDIGALINPVKIGSWIDMSAKGGMDGGWYFPVDVSVKNALEGADNGAAVTSVKDWLAKHNIDKALSIGRDMGAAPPRQTEINILVPGADFAAQLRVALEAFDAFGFPKIPDNALRILEKMNGQIKLSIITSSEGFVRLGILVPKPSLETVVSLANVAEGNRDGLASFEGALGVDGPSYVEFQYLMKGFGYSVYKEGFDIIFHYAVGEDRA